jgi:hypothetical protein
MGGSWQEVQRYGFWSHLLGGACGHGYGAQGLWAMSARHEPHRGDTGNWGPGYWDEALRYPGGAQLGLATRWLAKLPWWQCQPIEEPAAVAAGRLTSHAMGIPGKLRLYYFPTPVPGELLGMRQQDWQRFWLPLALEPGVTYRASFFDPGSGDMQDIGMAQAGTNGTWTPPLAPHRADTVMLLDAR